jgi:hypothetical protein
VTGAHSTQNAPLSTAKAERIGPWLTFKEAAAYVGCKTIFGFYTWRHRHKVVARSNHTVAKADLDRELNRQTKRRMAPASLANVRSKAS